MGILTARSLTRGGGGTADALASGASEGNLVEVQILSAAPSPGGTRHGEGLGLGETLGLGVGVGLGWGPVADGDGAGVAPVGCGEGVDESGAGVADIGALAGVVDSVARDILIVRLPASSSNCARTLSMAKYASKTVVTDERT